MRVVADVSRQQVETHFLHVGVTVSVLVHTDRETFVGGDSGVDAVQLRQRDGAQATEELVVEQVRLHGLAGSADIPHFARPIVPGFFCLEKSMILVISATYLCRRGDIDECIYAAISILGFIEILIEIALIASIFGK